MKGSGWFLKPPPSSFVPFTRLQAAPDAFSCAPDTFSLDGVFPYFNLDSKTWFSLFLHGKCCVNPYVPLL